MLKFIELSRMAVTALWSNKARSILTMLGIVIGIFAVATLIALGQGVKKEITGQIEDLGTNLLVIVPGKVDTDSGFANPSATLGVSSLKIEDIEAIKEQVPEIREAAPLMLLSGALNYQDKTNAQLLIIGTTEVWPEIVKVDIDSGRFLNGEELGDNKKVMFLGAGANENLAGDNSLVGKSVKFQNQDFEVVGVGKKKESGLSFGADNFDDAVYLPITTAKDITGNLQIFRIMVGVKESGLMDEAKNKIKQTLLAEHDNTEDFSVLTQEDLLKVVGTITNLLTSLLAGIAAISLLVGGIGIMNIMLVSVTERTKEIGLRKAVGATNFDIWLQFLIEAIVLSLIGGAVGVGLSWAGTAIFSKKFNFQVGLDLNAILLAVGTAVLVGIFFGVAPAIRASRKNPIEALRYE